MMLPAGTFALYFAICAVAISFAVGFDYCSSQFDCRSEDSCCANECVYGTDCLGHSCSDDSDCRPWEYCCDGTCSDDSCFLYDTGAIIGIVVGSAILMCAISRCCYYGYYRPRQRYRGRVLVGQRVTTTTITTRCTQPDVPYQYQGQVPPPYQQGYLHNPPPQYVQYPPYNAGLTKSSEPTPPPYSAVPEGSSGGVYTPQNTYGAVTGSTATHLGQ